MVMRRIKVKDIVPDTIALMNYYSSKGELLIGKGTLITEKHVELLKKRNEFDVYSNVDDIKELEQKLHSEIDTLDTEFQKHPHLSVEQLNVLRVEANNYFETSDQQIVIRGLDELLATSQIHDSPQGHPLKETAQQLTFFQRSEDYLTDMTVFYSQHIKVVKEILARIVQGDSHCYPEILKVVRDIVDVFLIDKNILLNISNTKPSELEHLYYHSLNVCILAINIAASYGYNRDQVIEVGIGALLHDSGMFLVPETIRYKNTRLAPHEWFEVRKHPILGLHLLEKIRDLPQSVMYITYQTHERQNSSGYPKQRSDRLIHQYAKIVQIADIFEAFSSHRPHRQALVPFKAAASLVSMATMNLVSGDFVKALILYMSTYPIGSLVLLNTHCIGRVIESNASNPQRPVISIISDTHGTVLKRQHIHQIDLNQEPDIFIEKVLSAFEFPHIELMHGF